MSKTYFNQAADSWDQQVNHDSEIIKSVINSLPDYDSPHILDIGSGTGVLVSFLKEKYGSDTHITELDFAEKMIEKAKKKHKNFNNINYIVGDIYDYPLDESSFDLIFCYSVFPHFSDKEKILKKAKSLLKSRGLLIIFHSQSRKYINNMHQEAGKEVKSDNLPPAKKVIAYGRKFNLLKEKAIDNSNYYLIILKK